MKLSQIELVAERVAKRELGNDWVDHVDARLDFDADGDRIWRILVILTDPTKVAATKLAGFVRNLRAELDPADPYPIVSFRSVSDNRDLTPEPA